MSYDIINGDCIEELAKMSENSVDAIVCDPPYSLSFMGKEWDKHNTPIDFQKWCTIWGIECLRILKPGGHLLAFGSPRTYHRLASGLEDAGFEIRDCIQWLYGSGFPKSHNVSKAIDNKDKNGSEFEGWGTALKPANEPIMVARKQFKGSVADNVMKWGTGAINIDDSRIGTSDKFGGGSKGTSGFAAGYEGDGWKPGSDLGRWPANVILSHNEDCELVGFVDDNYDINSFDEGAKPFGDAEGESYTTKTAEGFTEVWKCTDGCAVMLLDNQSIDPKKPLSRFFYSTKAAPKEKNAGITKESENDRFKTRQCTQCKKNVPYVGSCGCENAEVEMVAPKPTKNTHPTVKPIDVMRYLVRLVTPPGGFVIDPFMGSGTTGIAAILEGFNFYGIEKDADSYEIARERIIWWNDKSGDTKQILKENYEVS